MTESDIQRGRETERERVSGRGCLLLPVMRLEDIHQFNGHREIHLRNPITPAYHALGSLDGCGVWNKRERPMPKVPNLGEVSSGTVTSLTCETERTVGE